MTGLFSVTLFVSALLLFSVQPMMGKMLLPVFGGAPAVWQTTLVFFQAVLLAGYGYAHWSSTKLRPSVAVWIHTAILLGAGWFLPLGLQRVDLDVGMTSDHQALHLLKVLTLVVGVPFFILSSTSPLLQRWFSTTGHASAGDPYYLSIASNFGSFVALLAFPIFVEPFFTLRSASRGWFWLYGLLVLLILLCAFRSGRFSSVKPAVVSPEAESPRRVAIPASRRLFWVICAAVPSSLMLGLTTFITTEVASIPLLGILPLALYLGTFILAFAQRRFFPVSVLARVLPFSALCLVFQIFTEATHPIAIIVLLHLAFFWIAALLCHTRLAEDRPAPESLTEFYLWMSLGGVLGGLFNALLAPLIFHTVLEYPLAILVVCFFRPATLRGLASKAQRWGDYWVPLSVFAGMALLVVWAEASGWLTPYPRRAVLFGIGAILSFLSIDRPVRFALSLGAVLAATFFMDSLHGKTLYVERNFFGVSRVTVDPDGRSHRLVHGNTIHGRQNVLPVPSCEPLTYFHKSGPLGRIFKSFEASPVGVSRVAITGLGCGAIAGYAMSPGKWDYYEIDPAVIRIATLTNLFTFIRGCARADIQLIPGDARLRFREAKEAEYGLIIMDAFTSDSIPLHLLTREAIALYLSKLAPGGLLAINISNRYLDLTPVIAALAHDAGLVGYHWDDPFEEKDAGKEPSHWAILSRDSHALERFRKDERWQPLDKVELGRVWTDDFSNVLGVMKWRWE